MPTIRGILSLSLPSFSLLASVGLVVVAVAAVVGEVGEHDLGVVAVSGQGGHPQHGHRQVGE